MPTLDRLARLRQTLASLFAQDVLPAEIIIIDASTTIIAAEGVRQLLNGIQPAPRLIIRAPHQRGAATQRNEGVALATQPYLLFLDDDVDLEPGCIAALWAALQADPLLGGCGVVITNQYYNPPGRLMRRLYRALGCPGTGSLAGSCTGPALNFLPELGSSPPHRVDWLNLCCTLYRRAAVPVPPLLPHFQGYSLMEDAALALAIGRHWRLAALPAARLYHDSKPASYKDRVFSRERMELVNRWFVMRCVMQRDTLAWDLRQFAYQFSMLLIPLRTAAGWSRLPAATAGKLAGLYTVVLHGHRWRGYKFLPPP